MVKRLSIKFIFKILSGEIMKIKVCTDGYEVATNIHVTKKDLIERTWAKYAEVELSKVKKDTASFYDCYEWESEGHVEDETILNYEYIDGFITSADSNEKDAIVTLRNDKEWQETVASLKKFALSMLNQNLKQ